MNRLTGWMPAMVSPFDANGRLELGLIPDIVGYFKQHGMRGLTVCGTNGEAASLSVNERKLMISEVVKASDGLPVIAGTGAASITDALELTQFASESGATVVLTLPPFFYKNPSDSGLASYYRQIMQLSSVPVLLYCIPHQTGITISHNLIQMLADEPNFVGMKDSRVAWNDVQEELRESPHLKIFTGADEWMANGILNGSAGSISGTANSFPDLVSAVGLAGEKGIGLAEAQARLSLTKDIVMKYPLIANNKAIMEFRGLPKMYVRPPLVELTAIQKDEMLGKLKEAGLL